MANLRVLHIEDDPFAHDLLKASVERHQLPVTLAYSANVESALTSCKSLYDIVVCDYSFGKAGTIQPFQISSLRKKFPGAQLVALTMHEHAAVILELINFGFDQVMSKKDPEEIITAIVRKQHLLAGSQNESARGHGPGAGKTMLNVQRRIRNLLDSAVNAIHIYGESGTGKEVVADTVVQALPPNIPFVRVNCAAIAHNLLHAELFGYVRGAFTGATTNKRGLIEAADGGFIFLDEVALLPTEAQAALLRVLENGEMRRVGSDTNLSIKIRVISATNERLSQLVERGRFRLDLWQRLSEVEIDLPPLRQRREEIHSIIQSLMRSEELQRFRITESASNLLASLDWKEGNVRELRNCLRAMTENHQEMWLVPTSIPKKFLATTPAVECQLNTPQQHRLLIDLPESNEMKFESLCGLTLLKYLEVLSAKEPISLRRLSAMLGISRTALTNRLRQMLTDKLATSDQLRAMTGSTLAT